MGRGSVLNSLMQRQTRQRTVISEVFEKCDRPLTPQEVHELASQTLPSLGIATVYRALNDLVEEEHLQAVELPNEPARYELASLGHHHHFRCNDCGRVFDIHACPGNIRKLAPKGFTIASHEVLLYGTCADCR